MKLLKLDLEQIKILKSFDFSKNNECISKLFEIFKILRKIFFII